MAYLNDFINDIIEKTIIAPASKAAEIAELTDVIDKEKSGIEDNYSKIGKLYVEKYAKANDDTDLGLLVDGVKAREKKIKDSKLRIGELMGKTFCETCCEEVDEDALYCNNCGAKMPVKLLPGMVLCPHCNKAVREGIRFCTNCGGSMIEEPKPEGKVCPNCGWETTDMSLKFCDECGRRLEGGEEEEETKKEEAVPVKQVCPNCGFSKVAAGAAFCDECGRRMEPAE